MSRDSCPEHIISLSEIIETLSADGAVTEICSTAEAEFDAAAQKVSVGLNSFARRVSVGGDGEHLPQRWLPRAERVTEHLPRGEATTFAKDVFKSWVRKVRAAIPAELRRDERGKGRAV